MNNLVKRALSGIVYIALIVGCILCGPTGIQILAELFAILAVIELTKLLIGLHRRRTPALILDLAGVMVLSYGPDPRLLFCWIAIIVIRTVSELYLQEASPLKSLGISFMIQLYVGLPVFCLSSVGYMANQTATWSCNLVLALFIFLWLNDTGAYLVGSLCGKTKLFERISPKKTWEGFFGGWALNIVGALLFCKFCSSFFGMPDSWIAWIILATLVTFFGTWGDLVESMMKRAIGAKDSGHLIPGHGGILDRIDSFLLAMPVVFLFWSILLGNNIL